MVKTIHVSELKDHSGETATIQGFVHTLRVQSKIIFLILRDITGIAQVVIEIKDPEVFEIAKNLSHESVVRIKGLVKDVPQAPGCLLYTSPSPRD